jgi:hypothetical protein
MTALNVNESLNITGKCKINGEELNHNKITGDLEFLENNVLHGTISCLKEDGTHLLKLKSEKIVVDGDLQVGEDAYRGPISITTEEQATGEKFLGRDVYVKGWEGTVSAGTNGALTRVLAFFPSSNCYIVSYGGGSVYGSSGDMNMPFPFYDNSTWRFFYQSGGDLNINCKGGNATIPARIWVKYTKS